MRGREEKEEEDEKEKKVMKELEMPTWWLSFIAPDTPKGNLLEVMAESALWSTARNRKIKTSLFRNCWTFSFNFKLVSSLNLH